MCVRLVTEFLKPHNPNRASHSCEICSDSPVMFLFPLFDVRCDSRVIFPITTLHHVTEPGLGNVCHCIARFWRSFAAHRRDSGRADGLSLNLLPFTLRRAVARRRVIPQSQIRFRFAVARFLHATLPVVLLYFLMRRMLPTRVAELGRFHPVLMFFPVLRRRIVPVLAFAAL